MQVTKRFLVLAVAILGIGCATAARVPDAEAVGTLSASPTHVMQAPVHADTDLSVAFQPAGWDADGGSTNAATPAAPAATEAAVAPVDDIPDDVPDDVPVLAPKAPLIMGGAR
jgi:hypothetical protein